MVSYTDSSYCNANSGALSIASVLLYPKALGGCAVFGGFLPFDSSSFAARLTDEAKKVLVALNFYHCVV